MSPLMPAVRLAEAPTLPLPQSQEMRAPAVRDVALLLQLEDGLDDADEVLRRPAARQGREVLVETLCDRGVERGVRVVLPGRDEGLLHPPDPAVEDIAQGPARARRGAELGQHLAVHVVEPVELEVVVGDDDEAGREPLGLCVKDGEAGYEGLPAAVAAAQELDGALAVPREVELSAQLPALLLDTDRERIESPLRHEALPKRLEDVLDILLGQCAHPLPSRTYRFTPATTSMCTAKGAFSA